MISHRSLSAALGGCSAFRSRRAAGILAALVASAFLVQPVSGEFIYGIANQAPATALVSFDSSSPGALLTGVFLTGLQQNETILGIDFPSGDWRTVWPGQPESATAGLSVLGAAACLFTRLRNV
jgi:hypothetical protein